MGFVEQSTICQLILFHKVQRKYGLDRVHAASTTQGAWNESRAEGYPSQETSSVQWGVAVFNINVDLSALMQVKEEMEPDYQAIQQSLVSAATFVRDTWIQAVSGRKLPGMTRSINDDKYAKALNTGQSIQLPQMFHAVVMPYNYAESAEQVEKGIPAYDMKPNLLNGPKSRVTKDGKGRYNIVPFRHYTPKSNGGGASNTALRMQMPKSIFDQAKRLQRSIPSAQTGKVNWGQALQDNSMGGINRTSLYQHKVSPYQGMYRVGNARNSQYLTFRTVSTPRVGKNGKRKGSAPNSWIHPSIPANPVTQAVYNYTMPLIDRKFKQIVENMYSD